MSIMSPKNKLLLTTILFMAVVWEQFAISLLYLVIVIETELYFQVEPTATANTRWSRVEKKRIVIPMPKMIEK